MSVAQFDIVTLSVRAEFAGVEDIVNVYDFQKTDAVPADEASALSDLEDWIDLVYGLIAVWQAATTLYREFKLYNRTHGTVIGTRSITDPSSGEDQAGSLPPGVAPMISFPTQFGKVTGRKYLGAFTRTSLELTGAVNAAGVAALVTIGNTIRAPYAGATSSWQYGVVQKVTEVFVVPQTTLVTDVFAYQRRRKPGRGS